MPSLRLYTGNRLETLARELAQVLEKPLTSPLDTEVIVVQSRGMERWVSLQLAGCHGICANCRFPFPNAFVHEIFKKTFPDLPERSPFEPKIMTWKIMKHLPSLITKPGFESLASYLRDRDGHLKKFQLAERIADTFDQYLLFRPEMVLGWEKGQQDHWQSTLWRELIKESGKDHRAALGRDFLKTLRKAPGGTKGLPERISVFGISSLPRFHMQILSAIAQITEVNLFVMNPCKEYWGDILSDWEIKRRTDRQDAKNLDSKTLHLEKGNSLLASMGTIGRDFLDIVNEFNYEEVSSFEKGDDDNLLSSMQSRILNLRDVPQDPGDRELVDTKDLSIQIHSCHSPMREMEALQDQLLNMFEKDPGLIPNDILVMTPDIEACAPYIQAVFDLPADDPRRIPFSIADRSIRKESGIIDAFLAILDLNGGRFGASQVMAILESPAIRRRFELSEADQRLISSWVSDTRICWGIDGKNRSDLGLPDFQENTWKAGIARLLLGYAMPGHDKRMFKGVLPYDHVEGSNIAVLGRFVEFTERLFAYAASLDQPRALDEWAGFLMKLLEDLFMPDEETERETHEIRQALNDLPEIQKRAAFGDKIHMEVIKYLLGRSFENEGFGSGFITGGITFCAMLPMRSIPFKVICLTGINNDAYPRQSRPLSFDLIANNPAPGDRSRRNDDRYLFLEAILSARKKLYISYVGQNIRDNSPAPPSVLVSELVDYIEQCFALPGKNIQDHFITKHRLQPFCPEYFNKDEILFSYSAENCDAAASILNPRRAPPPFISKGLTGPEDDWKSIDIQDLCGFFSNPAKFLLEKRLRINLKGESPVLKDKEAFDIKGLDKYLLEANILEGKLQGDDLEKMLPLTRAAGRLPYGTVGRCIYEDLGRNVEHFAARIGPYLQKTPLEPLKVELNMSGFTLTGRIHPVYPERLIQYRCATIKPKDHLRLWIHHLALNSMKPDNYPRTSLLGGLKNGGEFAWTAWEYPPVEKSDKILSDLLEIYWFGLIKPLHFFPNSSWKYIQMLMENNKSEDEAMEGARNTWEGNNYTSGGECEEACYKKCFKNTNPLDSQFRDIAAEVFVPLITHRKEAK